MKPAIPFPNSLKKISKHRQFLYGFAALWIMFYHMETKVPNHGIWKIFNFFQTTGAAGVEIFLLLTGFGLYASMKKDPRPGTFYGKRFARVFLPSFIALALIAVLLPQTLGEYLGSITFFAHWFGVNTPWYVTFILTMYLIYPLIFVLTDKKGGIVYILAIISLALSFALESFLRGSHDGLLRMVSRIPVFLAGCAIAPRVEKDRPLRKRVLLFSLILTIPFMWLCRKASAIGYLYSIRAIAYFFFAIDLIILVALIAELLSRRAACRILYRFFAFCGQISLEIYLLYTRLNVLFAELPGFNAHPSGKIKLDIAAALCTLILAVLLQNIVESIIKIFTGVKIPAAEKDLESTADRNSKIR